MEIRDPQLASSARGTAPPLFVPCVPGRIGHQQPYLANSCFRGKALLCRAPRRRVRARGTHRVQPIEQYLRTDFMEIDWQKPDRRGSFGRVYFGVETSTGTDIVIKCPFENDKARELLDVEEHVNCKLVGHTKISGRWADYLGKIIVPEDAVVPPGVSRYGLVWRRAGDGETLEDYLQGHRVPQLQETMAAAGRGPCSTWSGRNTRLRVELAERVLLELVELLVSLQKAGVVHRDIKPDNLVVDPAGEVPLRCIDFGSSCDWGSIFKTGLFTNTCDPVYSAPERKLNLMEAKKFDVYSSFVKGDMRNCGSFEKFIDAAVGGRAGTIGGTRSEAELLDSSAELAPLRSLLCSMLAVDAKERADGTL